MAKPEEQKKARTLRRQGRSMKKIAEELKVSPGSVHRWCHDILLTAAQRAKIDADAQPVQMRALHAGNLRRQEKRKARREAMHEDGAKMVSDAGERDLLLLGLGLYWGEGSKRDRGDVSLVNMDPRVHVVFLRWLRLFGVTHGDLTLELVIAPGHGVGKHLRWWKRRLKLSRLKKERGYEVLSPTSKRKIQRDNYHGCLTIGCRNVDLWCRIMGMLEAVSRTGFEPVSSA